MNRATAPIMQGATHQQGAWIFRAPRPDPNFAGWTNQEGIKAARTVAFNLETGELGSSARSSRASMLTEGCTIVQIAFVIFLTIWSVIFGFIALARKRRPGDKLAA